MQRGGAPSLPSLWHFCLSEGRVTQGGRVEVRWQCSRWADGVKKEKKQFLCFSPLPALPVGHLLPLCRYYLLSLVL